MTLPPVRVIVPISTTVVDDILDHALKGDVDTWVRKITHANGTELDAGSMHNRLPAQEVPSKLHIHDAVDDANTRAGRCPVRVGFNLDEALQPGTEMVFCSDSIYESIASAVVQYAVFGDVRYD